MLAEVRGRAAELYETQNVTPGRDYVLSEVVHCKSRENEGVELAVEECADRYLSRVLSCAAAKIVVVLGKITARIMADRYGISFASGVQGPAHIAGRDRFVVCLGQPGSN